MHPPAAFEDPEDRHFLRRAAPGAAALPRGAEVGLVDLNLAEKGAVGLRQLGHSEAEQPVQGERGIVVQACQRRRAIRGDV